MRLQFPRISALSLAIGLAVFGPATLGGCDAPQGDSNYRGSRGNPYNPDAYGYNPYDPESGGSSPYVMRSNGW
jgi:hypothetical protein